MAEICYNTGVANPIKATAAVLLTPRGHDTRKGKFLMQPHSTRTPSFPQNLLDYAPWVAAHGLVAPYGKCQCECGDLAPVANRSSTAKGWLNKHPKRFLPQHHARKFSSLAEAFWDKITPGSQDECWIWQGGLDKDGYAILSFEGKQHRASRVSYTLEYGELSADELVCHRCDAPACVNFHHFFLGDNAANLADMHNKGREARGETHGRTILVRSQVLEIRRLVANGDTKAHVARQFGISAPHVNNIVTGKSWKHVP